MTLMLALWLITLVSESTRSTAIASIIAATIGGLAAWATQRTAAVAAVRNQSVASRTDIEKEAFDRAKSYYTDTIDRQDRERIEDHKEIGSLKQEIGSLKDRVAGLEQTHDSDRAEIDRLSQELTIAKQALHIRYPDEF